MKLKKTITSLQNNCQNSKISIGGIVDCIDEEAFGVLLLLPALIVLLPISIIPGVSSLCALVVMFTAFHIFSGRARLWLPQRIRNISFSGQSLSHVLTTMNDLAKKADRISRPRLLFLTRGFAGRLASAAGILLAAATLLLGFIPLIDMVLMAPIVFFGLGSCTGDGLITGLGWLILGAGLGLAGFMV